MATISLEEAQKLLELNHKEAVLLGIIRGAVESLRMIRVERKARWDKIIEEHGLDKAVEHGFVMPKDLPIMLEVRTPQDRKEKT